MADHMEALRIERQNAENTYARNHNLAGIANHQKQIFEGCVESREDLNSFLKSNYDNFFKEKLNDQQSKA